MKKKFFGNLVMITSLIGGLGMIYARWNDISSIVVDVWMTLFICSVAFSGIVGEGVTCGDENKGRNIFYRIWVVAIVVLLVSYILITILNN